MEQTQELWVLGGTGRVGARVAEMLVDRGIRPVLVGRNATRLEATTAATGAASWLTAEDPAAMAAAIRRHRPTVVVNTVGPFAETSGLLAATCLPSTSYVDVANDIVSANAITDLNEAARRDGRTLVTGAGFGVVGTEAPLTLLCDGRPTPNRVRVDSAASLTIPAGSLGAPLADSIIGMFSERGSRVSDGRLVPNPIGSSATSITLPDGETIVTGAWPSGDLAAASRISGAPDVVAATTEVPSGRVTRAALPVVRLALRIGALRRLAARQLAAVRVSERPMRRPNTWGHASAEWPDGHAREAWLRAGDANEFTAGVAAEAASRIFHGHVAPGAGTPIQLLDLDLVEAAGGEVYLAQTTGPAM